MYTGQCDLINVKGLLCHSAVLLCHSAVLLCHSAVLLCHSSVAVSQCYKTTKQLKTLITSAI